MKVELFTLCDGAYNYNGKMTIVGTITNIGVPDVPISIPIGLAMKLQVDPNESGTKQLVISFVNPDGSNIPADLKIQLDIEAQKEVSYIALAANIQNFPIAQLGLMTIKVSIDGNLLNEYHINVLRKE